MSCQSNRFLSYGCAKASLFFVSVGASAATRLASFASAGEIWEGCLFQRSSVLRFIAY